MTNLIESVEAAAMSVKVAWEDGTRGEFDAVWLRDNCHCRECGSHDSGARYRWILDWWPHTTFKIESFNSDSMTLDWSEEGHASEYESAWLRDRVYSGTGSAPGPAKKTLWTGSLSELPRVKFANLDSDDELLQLHDSVERFGFVLVDGMGSDSGAIEELAERVGYIRETHYGRIFDLVTRENAEILADSAGGLFPHTDEAYRTVPTGINFFHCLQDADGEGGLTQLVDAHAVAERLREENHVAFELMSSVPLKHERRIAREWIVSRVPAISLDRSGEVSEVRINERTMSAIDCPDVPIPLVYEAFVAMLRIAYDEQMRISYRLSPGEGLLFDNLRVLHGRTSYTGARHFRQLQVMRDEFYARGLSLREAARSA